MKSSAKPPNTITKVLVTVVTVDKEEVVYVVEVV
jgi:hypothetical protein